jgi:NAD(P)H-nitrite reductase large subunit
MNAIGFFGLHMVTAGNYVGEVYQGAVEQGSGVSGTKSTNRESAATEPQTAENVDYADIQYKKLFYGDNKLNGFIIIGNVEKAGIYTNLIKERTPLDTIDFKLVCESPGVMECTKEDRMVKLGGGAP